MQKDFLIVFVGALVAQALAPLLAKVIGGSSTAAAA